MHLPLAICLRLRVAILTFPMLLSLTAVYGDTPLIVVSIRQYQEVGPSNIHLYLYGLDGKLRKQLTNAHGLDDENPAFDYDGTSLIFTRTASDPKFKNQAGRYILDLQTGRLRRLTAGLTHNDDEGEFEPQLSFENIYSNDFKWRDDAEAGKGANSITSPDGTYTLIDMPHPIVGDPKGSGDAFLLRTGDSGKAIEIESLPGITSPNTFDAFDYNEWLLSVGNNPFVTGPSFAAIFLGHHLGSTDGNQMWGLDLRAKKWSKMSENGGSLYHLPNASGVFLIADSRYEPFFGQKYKSVNCAYLEWWDANLKMSRLGPPLSVFYGATFHFGPGETATINEIWGS